MLDASLVADPVEQHLPGAGAVAAGEHLAVVGQDLLRRPVAADRGQQRVTGRSRSRARHHLRGHDEPGMIVDALHDLRLRPVRKADTADDVHLPQLHRPRPLPPLVVTAATLAGLWDDHAVADTHR